LELLEEKMFRERENRLIKLFDSTILKKLSSRTVVGSDNYKKLYKMYCKISSSDIVFTIKDISSAE